MRKLLNTLYVTTPNAYLSKDGMNVVVSVEQVEKLRLPIVNIEGIVTFGYVGASPGLMCLCAEYGVSLTFLSPNGNYIGRFQAPQRGNVFLRKAQYHLSENPSFCLHLSQLFIAGKIQNYYSILRRAIRDNGPDEALEQASKTMLRRKKDIFQCKNRAELLGHEGDAANEYFGVFSHLIRQQQDSFPFSGRNRRPPKDKVNALLSFVYTLIACEATAALETVGLDPYVGFLHTIRPGRTSLALDLMEEFRAYLGDRLVLSLINRRQLTAHDFQYQGSESVIMTEKGRKTVLAAWQMRKKDEITHPYLKEKIPIGLLLHAQAMLLARYLRGDTDDYPVFLIP